MGIVAFAFFLDGGVSEAAYRGAQTFDRFVADPEEFRQGMFEDFALGITCASLAIRASRQPVTTRRARIQGRLQVCYRRTLERLLTLRLHGGTPKVRQTPAQLGPPRQLV